MPRYRRGEQVTLHLHDALEIDGTSYEVDLIAKRATGVRGYRVTVAFIAEEGSRNVFAELDPVESREAAEEVAGELLEDREGLRRLHREQGAGAR